MWWKAGSPSNTLHRWFAKAPMGAFSYMLELADEALVYAHSDSGDPLFAPLTAPYSGANAPPAEQGAPSPLQVLVLENDMGV
ncbi:hypothetical protein EMIT047CA2_90183 [Pseudomonas soli]